MPICVSKTLNPGKCIYFRGWIIGLCIWYGGGNRLLGAYGAVPTFHGGVHSEALEELCDDEVVYIQFTSSPVQHGNFT
jgi:hypothetical protein